MHTNLIVVILDAVDTRKKPVELYDARVGLQRLTEKRLRLLVKAESRHHLCLEKKGDDRKAFLAH